MLQTLVRLLRDDRGAATPSTLIVIAATSGLAYLAAHGLTHHLGVAQGGTPDGRIAGNLEPGAATRIGAATVPVGVGMLKRGGYQKETYIHTGEIKDVVTWR
ncbi:MAG: hypothetical protein AB1556_16900 [Bacillota bacterium]